MSKSVVIGSTGLVGSNILATLLAATDDTFKPIKTIGRRAPTTTTTTDLEAVVEADTSKWASVLSNQSSSSSSSSSQTPTTTTTDTAANPPRAVFSALGTTRAAAGSLAAQWAVDHDLNIALARAARAARVATYVFVSSGGTRGLFSRAAPYSRMKQGVEDAIQQLDFERAAIILRPGLILGARGTDSRPAEAIAQGVVRGLGWISAGVRDAVGQDAQVIARAAVRAARMAEEGRAPARYWVLEAADIVRLGRTEWEDGEKPVA